MYQLMEIIVKLTVNLKQMKNILNILVNKMIIKYFNY